MPMDQASAIDMNVLAEGRGHDPHPRMRGTRCLANIAERPLGWPSKAPKERRNRTASLRQRVLAISGTSALQAALFQRGSVPSIIRKGRWGGVQSPAYLAPALPRFDSCGEPDLQASLGIILQISEEGKADSNRVPSEGMSPSHGLTIPSLEFWRKVEVSIPSPLRGRTAFEAVPARLSG